MRFWTHRATCISGKRTKQSTDVKSIVILSDFCEAMRKIQEFSFVDLSCCTSGKITKWLKTQFQLSTDFQKTLQAQLRSGVDVYLEIRQLQYQISYFGPLT